MATSPPKRHGAKPDGSVMGWLCDSDFSIRWQVMRTCSVRPRSKVAAERCRIATEGAGGAAWTRGWNSTMHVLMLLRDLGLDPASEQARRALGLAAPASR